MNKLRQARQGDSADAIEAVIKEVDQASAEFAARRMDAGIRKALAGSKIDEI